MKISSKRIILLTLVAFMLSTQSFAQSRENRPAEIQRINSSLQGVAGFGQDNKGGNGGKLLIVSNLRSQGKGSFTEAVQSSGPRIIVFEVGGVIDLDGQSLEINEPYLTIAGHTAPFPGITLIRGGVKIATHDVIIQHLKVRPGEAGHPKKSGWEADGIATGQRAYNVIIDHCSVSWATDENISASGPRFEGNSPQEWRTNTSHKITISNCIIASGLSHSTHGKGEHSKGTLVHDNATEILLYGNLYANNVDRNPLCKGGTQTVIVNNYVYNPGRAVVHYGLVPGQWKDRDVVTGKMSVQGNYIEYGPNTSRDIIAGKFQGGPVELFWQDNKIVSPFLTQLFQGTATFTNHPPLWPAGLSPLEAEEIKDYVLQNAGAFPWKRDSIDHRLLECIKAGNGKIIDSEQEEGGYPDVEPVYKKFDPAEWGLDTLTNNNK